MIWKAVAVSLLLACAVPVSSLPVDLHYERNAFRITAPAYEFRFDLAKPRIVEWHAVKGGKPGPNLLRQAVELDVDSGRWRSSRAPKPAHLHPVRIGRYLTEITVENILLADSAGKEWPGIAEITFYCHPDKVYVRWSLIAPDQQWVRSELVVYQAPETHRHCPDLSLRSARMTVPDEIGGSLHKLMLARQEARDANRKRIPVQAGSLAAGTRLDSYFVLVPGSRQDAIRALEQETNPLPASAFKVTRGRIVGYNPRKGVYEFVAQDAPSGTPPRAAYGGCSFSVRNGGRDRRILIEQLNDWGGLRGAVIRDGKGNPLPIHPQISVNFPELREGGEPDWGYVLYPLDLAPYETKTIQADHLYFGYGRNDQILLMSLENVGDPVLLQTSVAVNESHTMTTGLYFNNPGDPHNDLRLNDFRRYKGDYGGYRSASAVLPSFFRYQDSAGNWHKVIPEHLEISLEGPVLVDYTVTGQTDDGKVRVAVRTIQAPHDDMTRVFNQVSVEFLKDTAVAPGKSKMMFIQHHTFNPMAFLKYAYTAADGSVKRGDLDMSGTVKENGTPLGPKPFVAAYYAPNGLEQGIPCSDITGNPGLVLLDWRASVNGKSIRPGLYIFSAKSKPDGGDYSRDLAIVPAEPIGTVRAGSKVEYTAESFVFGDVKSDFSVPARERRAFGLQPAIVEVTRGRKTSDLPPVIHAEMGAAEFRLPGGLNKLAVRVDGFRSCKPIVLEEVTPAGYQIVKQGLHGNDWYQCTDDGHGRYSFLFLAEAGKAYRVSQP